MDIDTEEQTDIEKSSIKPQVFLYVNPLTGKHASLNKNIKTLAVFNNELVGRQYETISDTLKKMVGYYVQWDEMIDVCNIETGGLYELYISFDY
jgi:hypothetical protein